MIVLVYRFIGKPVVERFSLVVTAEAQRANIGSKSAISLQRGPVDPKFQVEGVAPTKHSSSQKAKWLDRRTDRHNSRGQKFAERKSCPLYQCLTEEKS